MTSRIDGRRDQVIRELQVVHREGEWHARRGVEQDYHCIYCGCDYLSSYDTFRAAEFDHVIPLSEGGEHCFDNIVICCRTCNLLKSGYLPAGVTHGERIADARRYIDARRIAQNERVARIRALVRSLSDVSDGQ